MNPYLDTLQPYPFQRLNQLKAGITPTATFEHIALSIGEPKHRPPPFVVDLLTDRELLFADLAAYPATRGDDALRSAIAQWLQLRFAATLDPATQVLPVAGTREALFSFGQAMLSGRHDALAILPNPFYQIYEGAVLLRGATPYFVDAQPTQDYRPCYTDIAESVWRRCELVYLCSPGNPTGHTATEADLLWLIEQAERFDFVIAADECYSEIYLHEEHKPLGLLQVAAAAGIDDYRRCVVFHSLSKRSNLPGLRSGFVAGDAAILERYYQYRTYEGCALPNHVQKASAAAWLDEDHVVENRRLYREKFAAVTPILSRAIPLVDPQGGFYHWLDVGEDDEAFTQRLYREENITVLPGSYLGRQNHGVNPGANHVRVAWVAPPEDCIAAAERLSEWLKRR
jgi:N-succinyldiaminopimelate aminotransferase